ncbi:MAG TPA: AMP-binding protein [Bacteroidales bacterium]|nr:AMP-binding protein [Bacteroidales bacterium]HQN16869.1 AMP-binding protein [Bacteroidales bacterium]HQP16460.1 AMP-binding protein [Bacteroidales bacterium]
MTTNNYNETLLIRGFLDSAGKFGSRPALDIDNSQTTYDELLLIAGKIATLIAANTQPSQDFVGVLADRSMAAYSGILGTLLAGKAYVPLNHKFPTERTAYMTGFAGVDTYIVGQECYEYFVSLLSKIPQKITAIFPETVNLQTLREEYPQHTFYDSNDVHAVQKNSIHEGGTTDGTAYLLFTSGSTGKPKAVPISNRNATAYIDYMFGLFEFNHEDRFYQASDMTFDLSVQDIFLCWKAGACLCAPKDNTLAAIPRFIKDKKLTVWLFVPSASLLFSKMRLLKPNAFPSLRYSMFCGEALPETTAAAWQAAAPNSVVVNLYGPTETTVAIAHYQWKTNKEENNCINGIVPLGKVFATQQYCVVDESLTPVEKGQVGELCLSGSQVCKDYFRSSEKDEKSFIKIPSLSDETWYRTGDRVMADQSDCLYFFGRNDSELKIKGYRVNLLEIDHAIGSFFSKAVVATVALADRDNGTNFMVTFISNTDKENKLDEVAVLTMCKQILPHYMLPERVVFIDEMPLNSNGKIDRNALIRKYETTCL